MGSEPKLSRRSFCRLALTGGVLLGQGVSSYLTTYAQSEEEDDIYADDSDDFAEFLSLGSATMDDLADLAPDDNPELTDPRIDDMPEKVPPGTREFSIYLPSVSVQPGASPASSGVGLNAESTAAGPQLSHRERALQEAIRRLGYHEVAEQGVFRNLNKFSGYFEYFADNQSGIIRNVRRKWCADFASWAFDLTGYRDGKVPWENPASVLAIKRWAERTNHIYTSPRRGDIFVMRGLWRGKWCSHCGIVRKVERERGTFLAVEGNTTRALSKQKPGAPPYNEIIWVAHQRRKINELTANGGRLYHFVRWN